MHCRSLTRPPNRTTGNRQKSAMKATIICVTTICGRIAPCTMGSAVDRTHLENMRMDTGASLLGAQSLREGDPEFRGPGGILPEKRIRAVITGSGDIPVQNRRLFRKGPPPVIFTCRAAASSLQKAIGARGHVVAVPETRHGLSVLSALHRLSEMGAENILIEGGSTLNYSALAQKAANEICLTLAPKISGHRSAPSLADGLSPLGSPFLDLELSRCKQAPTGELFLWYRIRYR